MAAMAALVNTLVVSWKEAAEMKLSVAKAARVIPCNTCVAVAGRAGRTVGRAKSLRFRADSSSRSFMAETISPACSLSEAPLSSTKNLP